MKRILLSLVLLALGACGTAGAETSNTEALSTGSAALVAPVSGSIPQGMPARLQVGLFEETGQTWMKNSAVPWNVRYRYFVKGWIDNWGWGPTNGMWGLQYFQECDAQGYLPAVQYYQMNSEPGGGEDQFLAKTQNAATMRSYFSDFKVLMQRARDFGKPVLILTEADGFGLLEKQTQSNPNTYAAVAATGLPELSGLPNTVAGWGLAFLQLRKAVGANNVILGIHVSAWAGDGDLAHFSVTTPLEPEVAKVYGFLQPFGLASNVTGTTWDVLVGDPLDRDADFYRLAYGQDRWWDPSDSASIYSKSFNRYAEWLRQWNVASGKRWVLWQIPLGNSNQLNVDNTTDAPRAGYRDNRTEYFFGPNGAAHREKFASSGVIALLFGRGEGRQSSYTNDYSTDGQLFMKSRAGDFLKAGGLAIPATGSIPPTPPPTNPPPTNPPPTNPPPTSSSDPAPFNFESNIQGWTTWGPLAQRVTPSATQAWAGKQSLAVTVAGSAGGMSKVLVPGPSVPAGKTVSFHIWFPAGSHITGFQPYVQQGANGGWQWTGTWASTSALQAGAWNTITVQVPANGASPLYELGVEFSTDAAWTGTFYVDSVSW